MIVQACPGSLEEVRDGAEGRWGECGVVFSGLDHDVAGPIGMFPHSGSTGNTQSNL